MWVDDLTLLAGDMFHTGALHLPVRLSQGVHTLYVRVRAKQQATLSCEVRSLTGGGKDKGTRHTSKKRGHGGGGGGGGGGTRVLRALPPRAIPDLLRMDSEWALVVSSLFAVTVTNSGECFLRVHLTLSDAPKSRPRLPAGLELTIEPVHRSAGGGQGGMEGIVAPGMSSRGV